AYGEMRCKNAPQSTYLPAIRQDEVQKHTSIPPSTGNRQNEVYYCTSILPSPVPFNFVPFFRSRTRNSPDIPVHQLQLSAFLTFVAPIRLDSLKPPYI
ncbi:MAG: hypothetical protein ACQEXQ_27310, partial [Bacillota bacterium]